MSIDKQLLGQIFISHSSVDKPFVRRLSRRLQQEGYQVWLDEHELIPGDRLATKVSEALDSSNVVLVVVSAAAVKSKWLAFELNKATERMIQGRCRVIPVVIEKVSLPPEVMGLLYADFTTSFKFGFKSVLTALQHEATRKVSSSGFRAQAEVAASRVFGGKSYIDVFSEYKELDYEGFILPYITEEGIKLVVVYKEVSEYLGERVPLSDRWWREYKNSMEQINDENLFLVLTQRPISFAMDRTSTESKRVKIKKFSSNLLDKRIAVFVDLSGLDSSEWNGHIKVARKLLIEYATTNLRVEPIEEK